MSTAFLPARAKLCIASLDKPTLQVRAQYNPKELQIDKQIQWEDHKSRNNQSKNRQDKSEQSDLEFIQGPPRSMSIELLFDGYEVGESVEPDVIALEELALVQAPEAPASQQEKRRPHHCIITWGASRGGMRPFLCVIESLAVKYTMWDHGGMPVRATCTVKVKEAQKMRGSQKPPKDYDEERRDPRWERGSPPLSRNMTPERYMQELDARRERLGKLNK
ncbi:MAG TPA: hypothetical protein VN253_23925 [Kofleriaceae bacterium]|nr:hypothetical protein [Kofleriaceae bacterium]